MRKEIDIYEYINHILQELRRGVLLTTKLDQKVNPMTISWGQIGIEWNRLIFTAYIRSGRYTHKLLEEKGEFSVNVPYGKSPGNILGYCGTKSGREVDKVRELNLTLIEGDQIDVPAIKELPLTLECRVIYRQLQDKAAVPKNFAEMFYPEDAPSDFYGATRDYHTMFYGEVLKTYILE